MSNFNPNRLFVNLIKPATFTCPVEGRKYTLTHSDNTGELFLDIGCIYNFQAINPQMRDEVLAEWKKDIHGGLKLAGKVYIDGGEFSSSAAGRRFNVFNKEMDTAINAIVYGDVPLYTHYPILLHKPIYIRYMSSYPQYRRLLYYGTPYEYLSNLKINQNF